VGRYWNHAGFKRRFCRIRNGSRIGFSRPPGGPFK